MHDTRIDNTAQHIRKVWAEERRRFELRTTGVASDWGNRHMCRWDGGVANDGKHYNPVWPRIAALCDKYNLVPDLLVRAMFHNRMQYPPEPSQAVGNEAISRYRLFTSASTRLERTADIRSAFGCDKSLSTAEVARQKKYFKRDEAGAWRITLVTMTVNLSPLFRYCVACNQGWDDIAMQFQSPAMRQYLQNADLYDEVWGEYIPENLKKIDRVHEEVTV